MMEGLGGRRPNCRRTNSEGTGRQQLVLVLSAGQYRCKLGNQIFDVISTRYSPSNDEGHWSVTPKWSKPTSTRKITLNQCNSILFYTALRRIVKQVMKQFYQHLIKPTVQIWQNSILNGRMHNNRLQTRKEGFASVILFREKYQLLCTPDFLLAINFGERKTLATWRMLGVDGWVVGGCAFPGTQIPRTFSPGSVFRPSH